MVRRAIDIGNDDAAARASRLETEFWWSRKRQARFLIGKLVRRAPSFKQARALLIDHYKIGRVNME